MALILRPSLYSYHTSPPLGKGTNKVTLQPQKPVYSTKPQELPDVRSIGIGIEPIGGCEGTFRLLPTHEWGERRRTEL